MADTEDPNAKTDLGRFGLLFGITGGAIVLLVLAWLLGWL